MQTDRSVEQLIQHIAHMSRGRCIYELTHFEDMPLDFDAEFLESRSIEWLRHTLLAAVLTVRFRDRPAAAVG